MVQPLCKNTRSAPRTTSGVGVGVEDKTCGQTYAYDGYHHHQTCALVCVYKQLFITHIHTYTIHHISYMLHDTSCITHHTSYITHHTSHITHHIPHITHHTSHITHHTNTHIIDNTHTPVYGSMGYWFKS